MNITTMTTKIMTIIKIPQLLLQNLHFMTNFLLKVVMKVIVQVTPIGQRAAKRNEEITGHIEDQRKRKKV